MCSKLPAKTSPPAPLLEKRRGVPKCEVLYIAVFLCASPAAPSPFFKERG